MTFNDSNFPLIYLSSFLKFIDLRKAFISTIKEFLTTDWRPEVEESWVLLFDFMAAVMMKGFNAKS